jgi:HPt (histidine-containing phosphotransfer) domain-containing protein
MIELDTLNVEQGVKYTNDNEDLYKRILVDFYNDYKDAMEKLLHLSDNDIENCHILGHSLKGLTAILGSEVLPPLFYGIEIAAKENSPDLASRIEAVNEPFNALLNELQAKGFC